MASAYHALTSLIVQFDNKFISVPTIAPVCVCGIELKKIEDKDHIRCDQCKRYCKNDLYVWQCADEDNMIHFGSYVICNQCFTAQQTKEHSMNTDAELANTKNIKIFKCDGSISECEHFINLFTVMNEYHNSNELYLQLICIDDLIHNHIHLIYEHNHDEDFEYIHNKINATNCDIFSCDIFMRNHRNRNKTNLTDLFDSNNVHIIVRKQILDSIHCHYAHSFDIGHRLRVKEKVNSNNINRLIELLKNKHKKYREIHQKLDRQTSSKFVTMIENKNITNLNILQFIFYILLKSSKI
eukprot:166973_1